MPKPTVKTTFNAVDKMKGPMRKMGKAVGVFARGAAVGLGLVAAGMGAMVREASKIEDAVAGFTPLLGGAEKANALVEKLNQTAATTPFQFEAISKAASQLLPVMNQDIERTVETFRMLGDTAGGNAQKLDSITRGFTKAMLKNKVDMESLNMIAEAGVPIYSELADSLGVTVAEMMDMSRAGKISSSDLEDAFRNMTSEGGVFFNGMEIASKTLTGKLSTLKDNIALTAASIGTQLLPTIKPLVDQAIKAAGAIREWVDNNKDLINQKLQDTFKAVGNTIKFIVKLWDSGLLPALLAGVGAYIAITKAIALYRTTLAFAQAAQIAFNLAMTANPVGLVVAAIAILIAQIVLLIRYWDEVTAAVKRALDNKFITAALLAFTPFLALPILIIKAWEPIMNFFMGLGKVMGAVGNFLGGSTGLDTTGGNQQAQAALVGRNDASLGGGGVTNRSLLNVNIKGPQGTTTQQTGKVPGITVNTAFGTSGL